MILNVTFGIIRIQPFLLKIAALEWQLDVGMLRIIRSQSHASRQALRNRVALTEARFEKVLNQTCSLGESALNG
jgi:hypothetical protein